MCFVWIFFSPLLPQPQTKALPSVHTWHGNRNDTFQHHSWCTHRFGQSGHPHKSCTPKGTRAQEESSTDTVNASFPNCLEEFLLKPYCCEWLSFSIFSISTSAQRATNLVTTFQSFLKKDVLFNDAVSLLLLLLQVKLHVPNCYVKILQS